MEVMESKGNGLINRMLKSRDVCFRGLCASFFLIKALKSLSLSPIKLQVMKQCHKSVFDPSADILGNKF